MLKPLEKTIPYMNSSTIRLLVSSRCIAGIKRIMAQVVDFADQDLGAAEHERK